MAIIHSEVAVQDFELVCGLAKLKSQDGCVYHVNAQVVIMNQNRAVHILFTVSEWFVSGQTVASFVNGKER